MRILKLFKQLYNDFSSIPSEARNFSGSYLYNLLKLFLDRIIKTIGYVWHFFFRNKKYDDKIIKVGNYKIYPENISKNSIIYSCGIADEISFDEAISNKFGCDVYMFDPTDLSLKFMNSTNNSKLRFFNIGIWKSDGNIRFYYHESNVNLSVTNMYNTRKYFTLPCKSIFSLMKENKHNSIDILKMDIEGASFEVLNDLLDKKIYPKQIVAELERPFFIFNSNFVQLFIYLKERRKLHKKFKNAGYDIIEIDSNELLAIKVN